MEGNPHCLPQFSTNLTVLVPYPWLSHQSSGQSYCCYQHIKYFHTRKQHMCSVTVDDIYYSSRETWMWFYRAPAITCQLTLSYKVVNLLFQSSGHHKDKYGVLGWHFNIKILFWVPKKQNDNCSIQNTLLSLSKSTSLELSNNIKRWPNFFKDWV